MIRCYACFVIAFGLLVIALGTGIIDTDDNLNSLGMVCFGLFVVLLGGMIFFKRKLGIVSLSAILAFLTLPFLTEVPFYLAHGGDIFGIGTLVSTTVLGLSPIAIAVVTWKEFRSWI